MDAAEGVGQLVRSTQLRMSSGPGAVILSLALLCLPISGCNRFKEQVKASMDSNPEFRQSAVDNARKSCVQTATAKAPKLPGMPEKIQSYCDCFATKGLGKFSNSELASIGVHGGHFTPEQQAKLNDGVQMCLGSLGEAPATPTLHRRIH